jgi:hypothetical protein
MRYAYDAVLKFAAHDPLLTTGLILLVALIIVLGGMHLIRIFGRFLLVLIDEFKYELHGIRKVAAAVKREATSWKADD